MNNDLKKTDSLDGSNQEFPIYKNGNPIPYRLTVGSFIYKLDSYYFSFYEIIGIKKITENERDYEYFRFEYRNCITDEVSFIGLSDIENYYSIANDLDVEKLKSLSDDIYLGKISINDIHDVETPDKETSTDLAITKSKEYYNSMLEAHRRYSDEMSIIKGMIKIKVDGLKDQINLVQDQMQKTISKLNDILFTLELYGGIEESVKKVREGEYASLREPIYLQQDMLFMDEEVGDPENGGISYDSVDKFYEWLNKYNNYLGYHNYKLILPYQKSVAIMRVRRKASQYESSDVWYNRYRMEEEMKTCMLIRNGENIWVIHSKMNFQEKLFPDVEEFEKLLQEIEDYQNEKLLNKYRNGMVLIQGIFDRTDILAPVGTLNLLNLDSVNKGKIVYNYSQKTIEDGKHKVFFKWLFEKERNIPEGTRILFHSFGGGYSLIDRVTKYYASEYLTPNPPDVGIYNVELYEGNTTFKYLPSDEVFDENTYTHRPRKRRERVRVKPYDALIDFDAFSHRDLNYVSNILYDRKHRSEYLWLVPLMRSIKEFKNREFEEERPFMLMLKSLFPDLDDDVLLDYIFHWKTKNKWKRSLKSDDNKAYRMIVKKIRKDIKENNLLSLTASFSEGKEDD